MTETLANPPAETKAPDAVAPATGDAHPDAHPGPLLQGPEQKPGEIGGPKGPEPTRYGDWAFKGRCSDF